LNKIKRFWWSPVLIVVLGVAGFVGWAESTADPMPEALAALRPSGEPEGVTVMIDDWLIFQPNSKEPSTGLVFYPGGRVDPRAYAPAARAIASEGYLVAIVPMPLNLAVLSPNSAAKVIEGFPDVGQWAVGGHSLGGAMAARFADAKPALVEGLVLWASYPAQSDDLSGSGLEVLSVYGTEDGLATPERIESSRSLLPPRTRWVAIQGGNHAQFGWYGPQARDNPPSISRRAQQEEAVAVTVRLLQKLEER
jgi:dienelactone hydrolase